MEIPTIDMPEKGRERCENRNHFEDLLIWGMCTACYRVFSLPVGVDAPVFKRAENLKKLGV